jgi:hypothetical protein
MSFASVDTTRSIATLRINKASMSVFVATLFLSAFLLFSVQPFFAKMVLPRLGGSPAVWSVAMVFFQAMLLAGYLYAHVLSRYLKPRSAAVVHITIMCAALLFMPIAIPSGWETPPASGQPIWLLGLFTVSVGLPFFAVAANGPLLQNWFSHTGHPQANDPYFLYSASNLGSFASLFLFVLAIEPNLTVPDISKNWMNGFILLGILIAFCAAFAGKAVFATHKYSTIDKLETDQTASLNQITKWIALSLIPSGLLVAMTAYISTDIAVAPFLWIIPLALFLLTFIFAFARRRIFSVSLLSNTTTLLAVGVLCSISLPHQMPVAVNLVLHLGFFFSAALLCHTVLVDQRPAANQLTAFYLWMSFGGVLGGIFASLLSPLIFTGITEYPLLVILALFCRPQTWTGNNRNLIISCCVAAFVAMVISSPVVAEAVFSQYKSIAILLFCLFAVLSLIYSLRDQTWFLVQVILATGLMFGIMNAKKIRFIDRSFFGVVSVYESPDQKYVLMAHGSTLHGAMAITAEGEKPEPLTYYHRTGGIAASLFAAQQKWALAPLGRAANIGVVGLGTGSILCHRKPNENWTSYEIDKAVVDAASDPKLFRFVSDCGQNDPIIIADARLSLMNEANGKFDYLLIDAFSSDAVPVHLLTDEAFQLYFSKMAPGGILTIHVSNRYMELASIIQAIAEKNGYVGRFGVFDASPAQVKMNINPNWVVVLAKNEAALATIATSGKWGQLPDSDTKPWTDDYSDLFGSLIRGFSK